MGQRRAYTELGKITDLRHDRAAAQSNFQKAVMLCEEDNDPLGADADGSGLRR